ncbi:MAG: hypothetical protein ACUVXJ_02755 [Phycisphaerae bacterium]
MVSVNTVDYSCHARASRPHHPLEVRHDTPIERLRTHYRTARTIVYVWITFSVMMASALFDLVFLSRGIWRHIEMVLVLSATGVALLSAAPRIVSVAWAREIEKTLSHRGCPLPAKRPVTVRLGITAMEMCFWFGALILGIHFIR